MKQNDTAALIKIMLFIGNSKLYVSSQIKCKYIKYSSTTLSTFCQKPFRPSLGLDVFLTKGINLKNKTHAKTISSSSFTYNFQGFSGKIAIQSV